MTQRIIAGYNDTAGGRDALALAVALSDLDPSSELTVARVYLYNPPTEPTEPTGWRKELRDAAERELQPARERYGTRPRTSFTACCGVSPTDGLHRLADELEATTIVVGDSYSHGHGRVRLGSVTEQTLHGAPCAVAVAPAGYATRANHRLTTVAVAYNGSDESRRALRSAAAVARAAGARLSIVGVVEQAAVWYGAYVGPGGLRDVREATSEALEAAARSVTGVEDVQVKLLEGAPVRTIAGIAWEDDLLVLGSRGYGPVRRVLLGSVSSELVRHVSCPVLVVPRGAARRPGDEDAAARDLEPVAD